MKDKVLLFFRLWAAVVLQTGELLHPQPGAASHSQFVTSHFSHVVGSRSIN